jgi:hypothetical protein
VSSGALDDVLLLHGGRHDYLLYLTIVSGYRGSAVYHVDDTARVDVREYATGAFWRSSGGFLTVAGDDGRSGSVKADLAYFGGEPTPPVSGLSISGVWSC